MYLGTLKNINNVSEEYRILAESDEEVGDILFIEKKYRQAIYFYMQAMEKYIKASVFARVNPENKYFSNANRNHSLDKTIDFLLEVVSTDKNIKNQIRLQLDKYVLKGIRFEYLNNNLRYPRYRENSGYSMVEYGYDDCEEIRDSLRQLKLNINCLYKLN